MPTPPVNTQGPVKPGLQGLADYLRRKEIEESREKHPIPDVQTQEETRYLENCEYWAKHLQNVSLEQDIEERKTYAFLFFRLSCTWIAVIVVLLLLQGFGEFWYRNYFHLHKDIVLAAIGATTVNILGILYVVANYLFPKK